MHTIYKNTLTFIIAFLFVLTGLEVNADVKADQTYYKYWVELEDKDGTPFSIDKPEAFLSPKALERRKKMGIKIDASDLPVNPSYIQKIDEQKNITVMYSSKWFNAVVIKTENEYDVDMVEDLDFVKKVRFLGKWTIKEKKQEGKKEKKDNFKSYAGKEEAENESVKINLNDVMERGYGNGYYQARMLNLIKMHDLGYRGNKMTISVIDAGFKNYYRHRALDSLRANNQILGYYNIINNDSLDNNNGEHGLQVLSCIGSNIPDKMVGTAPKANFWLISSEDESSEYPIEEANWVRAAEFADSVGTDIITSSLGYTDFDEEELSHKYKDMNGKTAISSLAATKAVEKGIMVLVAAGNEGSKAWKHIASPGDAEKVLTIGGVNYSREHSSFSSYGPSYDKRTKPDLCARATYVYVADDDNDFTRSNGTSFATPIMAGAVACLMQANPTKSIEEIIAALHKSGDHSHDPNNTYGYGIPDIFIAHSTLNRNPYFDYTSEKLFNPGLNTFENRIFYRFYSPAAQTVTITVVKKGKKKDKEVYNVQKQVSAEGFLQGEVPKVKKYKKGEYVFTLTTANGTVYTRKIEK